jgi:hypothetical protein
MMVEVCVHIFPAGRYSSLGVLLTSAGLHDSIEVNIEIASLCASDDMFVPHALLALYCTLPIE